MRGEISRFTSDVSHSVKRLSSPGKRRSFVGRDMIGFITFDLILRVVGGAVPRVALVVHILRMNARDRASDLTRFGVPANVITDRESVSHGLLLSLRLICNTWTGEASQVWCRILGSREDVERAEADR